MLVESISDVNEHPAITAFIVCCNEADTMKRCLESVQWCNRIIIVDSGSTDETIEICKQYTSHILHHPWQGYVGQKQFALDQCSTEWILNLDADEEVSPELKNEILDMLQKDKAGLVQENGFLISRVVFYLGIWWRRGGWYPEYRLRLSRREKTTWGGTDPHEKALVSGKIGKLNGELYHYTYDNITEQISRLNKYASSAAQELSNKKVPFSLFHLIFRPLARFTKFYFLKRGYRDGVAGFIVAAFEAYYVFLKYAKLWEITKSNR